MGTREVFIATVICGYMIMSTVLYNIVTKLTYGTRDPADVPDKFIIVALAQLGVVAAFSVVCAWTLGATASVRSAAARRYCLGLLPYGAGMALAGVWLFAIYESISSTVLVGIIQGRLVLDAMLAYFLWQRRVTRAQVAVLASVLLLVPVHLRGTAAGAAGASAANADWERGVALAVGYAVFSSLEYAYLAHVSKVFELRRDVSQLVIAAWNCATSSLFCKRGSLASLSGDDLPLILLTGNLSVAWFLGIVRVSPLAMTLCSALVLVVVYFFEQWWFAIAFERVPMLSALGLAGAVAAYGALSAEEAKAEAAAKRVAVSTELGSVRLLTKAGTPA